MEPKSIEAGVEQSASNPPERVDLFSATDSVKCARTLEKLIRIENCCHYLRMSNYPVTLNEDLNELISRPCALSEIAKYQKLNEFVNPFPDKPVVYKWLEMDLCIATQYAKALDVFKLLSPSDQCLLLRQTANSVALLTEAYKSYEMGFDTLAFPDGSMPSKLEFFQPNSAEIKRLRLIIETVRRRSVNLEEYVLVKGILFLSATLEKLSDDGMQLVSRERDRLCLALLDYLMRKVGPAKGPAMFGEILSLTHAFLEFSESRRTYFILHELFGNIELNLFVHQLITRKM